MVLKLSDLAIPAYTKQSRQVKQEHTCQHNFGGILERGKKCALYSTLSEICIVVSKETSVSPDGVSEETWQVATDDNGKTIGCANENLGLGTYTRIKNVELVNLSKHMDNITVRVRSYNDPAIQALLITEGTFVIGLDPKLKMALSIAGIIVSLTCFACIIRQCIVNCRQD